MTKKKVYDKQFKIDAVNYVMEHPEITIAQAAENLDVPLSNLNRWRREVPTATISTTTKEVFRGSGNHASEEAKEAARLRRENKDLKDALEILKKAIGILGD